MRDIHIAVFSPDGTSVLAASEDGIAHIFCAPSGECMTAFRCYPCLNHLTHIVSAVFSPEGTHVLTTSNDVDNHDGTVQLWDITSGECVARLDFDEGPVHSAVLSP